MAVTTGCILHVTQPYDGELIAEIPVDTAAEIESKLQSATCVFSSRDNWLPAYERIAILRRLARLVEDERDEFALSIAREGGKPIADAKVEVTRAINGIECAASYIEQLAGSEIPMGLTMASANRWAFTTREPIGPVVAISAFNHPLNLIVHQIVPAIAAGCPVLVKPAPVTPLTCMQFVSLVYKAGLPEPWCQLLILESNDLAQKLATDPRVAFLNFIGSARVGWYLRSQLAPGTRCALEHGGAASVLIDRSADVGSVVEPLVKGGYYHAGQVCVSVQRIFVHEDLKPSFIQLFSDRVKQLVTGDPCSTDTEVGPLIAPREVTRVAKWVAGAIAEGATVSCGGQQIGERLYQPTILVEPDAASLVSTSEIFGPVTCVYGFTQLSEAIARANRLPYAFQASIFSRDIEAALYAAKHVAASTVMVNDHTAFRTDWMPFAGHRQSGLGTGGIPYTIEDLMQSKMIVLRQAL
jgi:acyl-CoA reductase-like NAD-dependent aldehyde dehydrogenase